MIIKNIWVWQKIFIVCLAATSNVDISHFENAFNYCLNDNPYARLFMIELDSKIVGYGNISLTYSIEAGGNVVFLEELYIKKRIS